MGQEDCPQAELLRALPTAFSGTRESLFASSLLLELFGHETRSFHTRTQEEGVNPGLHTDQRETSVTTQQPFPQPQIMKD